MSKRQSKSIRLKLPDFVIEGECCNSATDLVTEEYQHCINPIVISEKRAGQRDDETGEVCRYLTPTLSSDKFFGDYPSVTSDKVSGDYPSVKLLVTRIKVRILTGPLNEGSFFSKYDESKHTLRREDYSNDIFSTYSTLCLLVDHSTPSIVDAAQWVRDWLDYKQDDHLKAAIKFNFLSANNLLGEMSINFIQFLGDAARLESESKRRRTGKVKKKAA